MTELMSSGVELMFAGMGIVFLFLTMLVVAINIMSSLVQRFFPDAPIQVTTATTVSSGIDKSIIAAIAAAVHQHRNKHKQS
ncbi:MAG: OadG family protein [Methylococcaceae bacterium]|jgi:oxaloacetate decarboxylase gamma subunit|nr:OadG family protein [Methylococcaceae bacterium]OYV19658.1 MAG: oxaloacetate decarboxylase, gamma subunit [Methylococcaceae bacterium NSP1-1]OYV22850.1 MAG: oxaloacetate decarboxylase, gamma subunit [Methylococcaceae bacterium NSO1]MDD1624573.1 OadG family protein [Methylococcaceae bacterium]MDD1629361.1 OadG family protein [Methylococcaceae bacterium]